ncbi:MAG: MBL fold metallo-hydrolase [Acidobacteria bacterium]|nr:MBL fold metallo-hydrolase [Acidobacteriota bacterium]
MDNALIHEILPVGWLQCNCSVVGDPETREAIVLDPGDEVERIQEILARHGLTVRAIVNTHAHIDHVGGLRKLHDATGAPVLMHSEDLELYRALEMQAAWIGMPVPEIATVDGLLREGDQVRWGRFAANVIHTPGHTPGSLCLHLPACGERSRTTVGEGTARGERGRTTTEAGKLFAGDTLFAGSIGRTDLWGGSFDEIMRSLQTKLLALPDETLVFPGHGPATTIGRERDSNPFLSR